MTKTKSKSSTFRFFRRFAASRSGATAVEFALVATPFFVLMFALIEVSLIYFGSLALENAMLDAARQVRTGQLQANGGTVDDFKAVLCSETGALIGCNGNLHVDVRTFDQFGDTNFPDPISSGQVSGNFQFNPGDSGDVVLVRAFYVWQVHSPLMSQVLANLNGGKRLLAASAAFRNEPFDVTP